MMKSFTSSNPNANNDDALLHNNLELECHYLTQALSKLERHSPEWKYMLQRLEAANKELDERQRQNLVGANNNHDDEEEAALPPPCSTSPSLPTGGRYVIEVSPDHRRNNGVNIMDGTESSASSNRFDNTDDPNEEEEGGCVVSPLQDDDDDDDASFAPFVMRDTESFSFTNRKSIQTCLRFGLLSIMLITGILLVAMNVGKQSTSTLSARTEGMSINGYSLFFDQQNITEPCASFAMHLILDQFGNETTWKVLRYEAADGGLRNSSDKSFTVVFSGGPYSYRSEFDDEGGVETPFPNVIVAKTCLPVGAYKFIIYDVRGDGICCNYGRGEYGINLSKGRVIRPLSSISFSSEREATSFMVTVDDIDIYPAATTTLVSTTAPSMMPTFQNDASVDDAIEITTTSGTDAQNSLDESNLDLIPVETNPSSTDDDVYSINSIVTAFHNDTMTGKSYGILFDIENTATDFSFEIKGMDLVLATTSPTHYEIWSKEGSWQDVIGEDPDYFEGFRLVLEP